MNPVCKECNGLGKVAYESGRYLGTCGACHGTGKRKSAGLMCESCEGTGFNQGACVDCVGTGRKIPEEKA